LLDSRRIFMTEQELAASRPSNFLCAPVARDMARVESILRRESAHPNPFVQSLVEHTTRFQGKRLRPALLLTSARILGEGPQDLHFGLAAVIEMLHTATLSHDDVLDESQLRRNLPTLNQMWGNEVPVLFGDYLFAKAYALCARLHHREANLVFAQAVQDICVGELSQIAGRFNFDLTEGQYLELIRLKTAVLFSTACRLGGIESGAEPKHIEALAGYGERIGMAFQIVDDCLDITGDERLMGKSLGTDLAKGKLTLPLLRLLPAIGHRELEALLHSPDVAGRRKDVLRLAREHDVLASSLARAREFVEEAKESLAAFSPSPYIDSLVALADFVVAREV